MEIVVERRESRALSDRWALIYGRKKVGKTFMLRRFYSWDYYILVGRDGTIWIDGAEIERFTRIDEMLRFLLSALKSGKRVVVDEFQRLPSYVLERLSMVHPSGTLILSGSSMRVVKDVIGSKSPLLGLVEEQRMGLMHPQDLVKVLNAKTAVDYMVYLRDPWLIPMMEGNDIMRDLYRVVTHTPSTIHPSWERYSGRRTGSSRPPIRA